MKKTAEILLIDDNPADVDLMRETLAQSARRLHVSAVTDGKEALSFLREHGKDGDAPLPDLVILDLNLPRMSGREVLAEIKTDSELRSIPILIFTTSEATSDVTHSYELGANCYLRKPGNLADFVAVIQFIERFWLDCVTLPERRSDDRPIHPRAVD